MSGRDRERALLDAWREAHWSLRVKLQEVKRQFGSIGIEPLYDQARRCDNELNEFYQARAEMLARQLRELSETRAAAVAGDDVPTGGIGPRATPAAERVSVTERALLARLRDMTPDDRASMLRLAVQLTTPPGGSAER